MTIKRTIKTLLVDCDGVLNDNDKCLEMQGKAVASFFGVDWQVLVETWFTVNQEMYDTYRHKMTAEAYYEKMNIERPLRFKKIGERLKKGVSDTEAKKLAEAWQSAYSAYLKHPTPFDDALSFLKRMKNLGISMVLVSGMTEENRWNLLKKLDFATYFSKIYASNSVGCQKQQPEFYKHVLSDLNLNGKEVAIVGDKCNDDISAGAFGVLTILLSRHDKKEICSPDYTVANLEEAGDIIEQHV